MSHSRVTVYIPSSLEKSEHHIRMALQGFAGIAGGASRVDAQGAWTMADGSLCVESIAQVSTIVDAQTLGTARVFAERYAQEIKSSLNQEAVLVTIEPISAFVLV